MIATRFRSVYWVGGVAVAALGCYLVSQRVAAERQTLTRVETEILVGKRAVRALRTEIGTRAGLNQIERWNADVLALQAPKSGQLLASEVQLAALIQPTPPAMDAPAAVVPAAATTPVVPAAGVTRTSYASAEEPAPARPKPAAAEPVALHDEAEARPIKAVKRDEPKPRDRAAKAEVKLAAKEVKPAHAEAKADRADVAKPKADVRFARSDEAKPKAEVRLARTDAKPKPEARIAKAEAKPKKADVRLAEADNRPARAETKHAKSEAQPAKTAPEVRLAKAEPGRDGARARPAVYVKPGRDRENVALLDDRLLGDLTRIAARERSSDKSGR